MNIRFLPKVTKIKYLEFAILLAAVGASAGITYWIQEAQYDKQSTVLQQEIRELNGQVQDLKKQNSAIQDRFEHIQKHSEQLQACIIDLKNSVEGAQNHLQDPLRRHQELNALGEVTNGIRNFASLPSHGVELFNTWNNGNCHTAQSIVEEQYTQLQTP